MIYPLVLELAAPDAPLRVPVTVTCRVLGFSTQGFLQMEGRTGQQTGLGRRAPDQRRAGPARR
jgi:hypothetical protein